VSGGFAGNTGTVEVTASSGRRSARNVIFMG
jgi:hypothetical protein